MQNPVPILRKKQVSPAIVVAPTLETSTAEPPQSEPPKLDLGQAVKKKIEDRCKTHGRTAFEALFN